MFNIDKKKFGAFVAALRKEKGITQKELSEQLCISDKAVSKWETGVSLPDTVLLIPLANLLDVSVTELLMCEKLPNDDVLKPDKVEDIVKTAITYADESPERAYHVKSKWIVFYGFSLLICCIGTFLNYTTAQPCMETLETLALLSAVFGAYFCCFVRTKLSSFYDENSVNIFYDGPFRMNVPGVKFNNRNWPHIVRTLRLSLCLCMILFPIINIVAGSIVADVWENIGFSADNGRIGVLDIVLRTLSAILDFLEWERIRGVLLLKQRIAHIPFIIQHVVDSEGVP